MKRQKKTDWIIIGAVFGLAYLALEVILTAAIGSGGKMTGRPYAALMGKSSLWMWLLGGIIGYVLGLFNENAWIRSHCNVFTQSLIGALFITVLELIFGLVLNVWLKFDIWNYNDVPFNFMGQICLLFSGIWFFLNPLAFWLDDLIRGKCTYELLDVYKDLFRFTKKTTHQTLSPIQINTELKIIRITVMSLNVYRRIMEQFEKPPLMQATIPLYRLADDRFEVVHGWVVTDNVTAYMSGEIIKL